MHVIWHEDPTREPSIAIVCLSNYAEWSGKQSTPNGTEVPWHLGRQWPLSLAEKPKGKQFKWSVESGVWSLETRRFLASVRETDRPIHPLPCFSAIYDTSQPPPRTSDSSLYILGIMWEMQFYCLWNMLNSDENVATTKNWEPRRSTDFMPPDLVEFIWHWAWSLPGTFLCFLFSSEVSLIFSEGQEA